MMISIGGEVSKSERICCTVVFRKYHLYQKYKRKKMSGYRHITPTIRKNNLFTALGLVGFVGGVYAWTYYKMKNVCTLNLKNRTILPLFSTNDDDEEILCSVYFNYAIDQ